MTTLLDRTPPQNTDLEESVLSSLFIDNSGFEEIYITPDDFYKSAHSKIFQAMLDLRNKKEPVDLMTVAQRLKDKNELELIGGASYLANISDSAPVATNIKKYAQDIKDLSNRREIIRRASELIEMSLNNTDNVLSYAQKSMLEIQDSNVTDKIKPISEYLTEHICNIEDHQTKEMPEGFNFGTEFMDKILRVTGSKLIIISARPSVGKTSYALSVAKHIAENYQTKVGFLSLEMDKEPLFDRLLSVDADINHMKFYNKNSLSSKEFTRLSESTGMLSRLPLYIDDAGRSIEDIERVCRKMKREGFGIIFIDQASKIQGGSGKLFERFTERCNRIADLKKELRIPIVLLAQLRRDSDAEPTLSDLKQTGAFEEDADIVIFLDRPYKRDSHITPNLVKIICAKNRQGAEGFDEGEHFLSNRGMFKLRSEVI